MLRRAAWVALSLAAGPSQSAGQKIDLPARGSDALTGTELAAVVAGLSLEDREARILQEIRAGNVPTWVRTLAEVRFPVASVGVVTIRVTPDYLAVGADDDAFRVPLSPHVAQHIADVVGAALPTPSVVDRIWQAAALKLDPQPLDPGPRMTTVPVFVEHDAMIDEQLRLRGAEPGHVVAGHKKDVVVSLGLADAPGRVAIYGWHRRDGEPIQPLYLGHTDRWADYSHGIRLVAREILVDGEPRDWFEALEDDELAAALSAEGPIQQARYVRVEGGITPLRAAPASRPR